MIHKHYDVIVLGRSIGALVTAALLARCDFTVMVVGQGDKGPSYRFDHRILRRRAFTMLAETSPVWRRVLVELAQSQTWKRRLLPANPMLQVLAQRLRFDIPPDMSLFGREIDREFPELRRVIDDLYAELATVNGAADEAFGHDAVWPPGTFWERRETGRYASLLPYAHAEPDADLMVEFPRGHVVRTIVTQSVLFATDLSALPPPFAVARLHGAWTRGLVMLARGEEELEEFLVERIAAHGGLCLLDRKAETIQIRRGTIVGVVLDGDDHPTGGTFVITDRDGETLAGLAGGEGIHKRALREWPRITSSAGRFVVSFIVRKEALPEPLGPEVLLLPAPSSITRSPIHLQRYELPPPSDESLLVAEVLVPERGPLPLTNVRQMVVDMLISELPFLERHLVIVDSVHDGLPLWFYEGTRKRLVDRTVLKGASTIAEPMIRQLEVDPPGYLGLAGEPIRGPIERTLLVGRSVLPGLGQEGQLLAAWGAARLITRSDKKKERMRRDMWSKIEIG